MSGKHDKHEKADTEAPEKEKASHKHHDHAAVCFVRAGDRILSLQHIAEVLLPIEGDAKQPLTIIRATGANLQLVGEDADAFLEALGAHCDTKPCKPKKDEKPAPEAK